MTPPGGRPTRPPDPWGRLALAVVCVDALGAMARLRVPVLFIVGADDRHFTEQARVLAAVRRFVADHT